MILHQDTLPSHCPVCEGELDAVTSLGHTDALRPGDISLCFYCGELLEWRGDGYSRATPESLKETAPDQLEEILHLQARLRQRRAMP